MRALVVPEPRPVAGDPLEPMDLPDPVPEPDELVIRVAASAVCRTDLQIATGDVPPHRSPVVPGHQAVGVVETVGSAVDGWATGDRAGSTWLASFDGTCEFCTSKRGNLCHQAEFTGWDRDGGFAEKMAIRADVAVRIPDNLSDLAAAPLLCGGVIAYRALRLTGIQSGGRLGLYGFGASARQAIRVALHWGCSVHVASRNRRDLDRALELGASSVGGYDERPPSPLQAAITVAPAGSVVVSALRALDRGGTVVVNAIHLDGIPAFSYDDLWWERSIRSVANVTRADAREFIAQAASLGIESDTETHPLVDGNEALRRLDAGDVRGAAVLIP